MNGFKRKRERIFGNGDGIIGSARDDTIISGSGTGPMKFIPAWVTTYSGMEGNNTIDAGGGNHSVFGGHDADSLAGGLGNDSISGGYGKTR